MNSKLINYQFFSNGIVKIETSSKYNLDIFPIKCSLQNQISGKIIWEIEVLPDMWAETPNCSENCNLLIQDKNQVKLAQIEIDDFFHGDEVQNLFNIWSNLNYGSLGLVIGANNGEFGEWVNPIKNHKLQAILFEPTKSIFKDLKKYFTLPNTVLINKAVTLEGGYTSFYQDTNPNSQGLANTTLKEFAQTWLPEFEEIQVEAIKIKNVLEQYKPKWVHLDVEGIDIELILEILKYDSLLPEVIIYEHLHIENFLYKNLENQLISKGYKNFRGSKLNSIAIKR